MNTTKNTTISRRIEASSLPLARAIWCFKHLRELVYAFSNWSTFFSQLVNPLRNDIIVRVKSGPMFLSRRITTDRCDTETILENWLHNQYFKNHARLSHPNTIIDIGAHIGTFSIYAATLYPEARVLSYEPVADNFLMLEQNIRLNRTQNIKAFNLGVASNNGERLLSRSKFEREVGRGSAKWSMYEATEESTRIRCVTLEHIFEGNHINYCDFLKMDCEGAEYEILLSTPKSLLKRISKISLEYHDCVSRKSLLQTLVAYLKESNFSVQLAQSSHQNNLGMLYAFRS